MARQFLTPVHTIISGGQTGADQAGLEVGRLLGLVTGGTCPAGWRTDEGAAPHLAALGVVCHESDRYAPRTEANVKASDATVWFGDTSSPGGKLTKRLCGTWKKPFLANPTPEFLRQWLRQIPVGVLNVAGNRARTNPDVGRLTRVTLIAALTEEI